jgi:membrane-associated PAP2 superfamily phosphatase
MHKFIVALTAAALLAALAMRKSITLSRRPIRLANDAEWGIFCGIVSLSKDILGKIVRAGAIIACPWRIRNYAAIGIWNRPRQ